MTVGLSLHQDHKSSRLQHDHSAEYIDTVKINFGVKSTAAAGKGMPRRLSIKNLQGVQDLANMVALVEAGGIYMNLKGVHNAGAF